jgi:hypothetical protein
MNILFPVRATWKRERALLIIFCLANLVFGQVGLIWALLVSQQKNIAFGQILDQNLQNANLAVFAVSLLVTTGTVLIGEYLEEKELQKIELRGHKAVWALIALLLVVFQAMLTGYLIPESMTNDYGLQVARPEGVFDALGAWGGGQQVVLWLISMAVAVHIFCLSRMHKYPLELDQIRQAQIAAAAAKVENMNETSDNEKI